MNSWIKSIPPPGALHLKARYSAIRVIRFPITLESGWGFSTSTFTAGGGGGEPGDAGAVAKNFDILGVTAAATLPSVPVHAATELIILSTFNVDIL